MCCEIGHPCNCKQMITCHGCQQKIATDDFAHIDSHFEDDGQTCADCNITVPKTYNGLCRSCEIDRRIAGGKDA